MTTPVRVAGFLTALAVAFVLALGVGNAVGPVGEPPADHVAEHDAAPAASPEEDGHGSGSHGSAAPPADAEVPGGLMISRDGYTLRLADAAAQPGREVPVRFTIEGPDGRPVTAYDVEHGKRLHLIVVRRDFSGYQHVHPELGEDGTWSTDLDLTPGQWRVFADFTATGAEGVTLGADLAVPGDVRPEPPAGEIRTAEVDGYTVTLEGDLAAGDDAALTLRVARGGEPVTDLEPYLGAYGHLVALREGDLAYLHVHPEGTPGDADTSPGPEVSFAAAVPSDGGYRLFFDFKHDGVVRTAEFALSTTDPGVAPADSHEEGDHDH